MTGRRVDEAIRDWVASGPEIAPAALVERTLEPIPHMRQRRGWPSRLRHSTTLQRALGGGLAVAAAVALLIALPALVRIPGPGASPSPSAPPTSPARPSFDLHLNGTSAPGTYREDPAAPTNLCTQAPGGSWRWIYGGGVPFVTIDMAVGAAAGEPGNESQVAVDIEADTGVVRFDPTVIRGGDAPGRSTASVSIERIAGATRFTVIATTPDRSTGEDGSAVDVELTVTCPG